VRVFFVSSESMAGGLMCSLMLVEVNNLFDLNGPSEHDLHHMELANLVLDGGGKTTIRV